MTRVVMLASSWLVSLTIAACSGVSGGDDDPPDAACTPSPCPPDAGPNDPDGGTPPDGTPPDGAGTPDASVPVDGAPGAPDAMPAVLQVCASGAPYTTIGAAIAAAPGGSTIEICAGTYNEHLTIAGKQLHLRGVSGAGATFLDAGGQGTALVVSATQGTGVVVEGITIRNGNAVGRGGGLRCTQSVLCVRNAAFEDNRALEGGGLSAHACEIDIVDTAFTRNRATEKGGGAYVTAGSGMLTGGVLRDNQGKRGGGLATFGNDFLVRDAKFIGNQAGLQGGALYYAGSGAIENNRFEGNSSGWTGGGLYIDAHMPTLTGNEILANTSENDGAGVYVYQGMMIIKDNHFADNVTNDDGGGLRLFESASLVQDNVFERNRAADSGAGIRVSHVPATFIDNVIVDNVATGVGGGMDLDNCSSVVRGGLIARNKASSGGGIHAWMFPWLGGLIEDVAFVDNEAWRGGAMMIRDNFQLITLRGLTVRGNVAGHGAGLYIRSSRFALSHSSFVDNWTSHEGGALVVGGKGPPWDEPICPCPPLDATGTIDFVVAYDNAADEGGSALWVQSPDLLVRSSIFLANEAPAILAVGPEAFPDQVIAPTWRYNDVFPASFVGFADPTGTNGNLSSDPLFTNAAAEDFHLTSSSPCVDSGDPEFLDADNTRADMGMYGGLGGTP
ncbi:MAG TPA: right-handed parallel beta-helix repeat-containing protein [Kofleriaceae bacterium]|nr:right-handed parallel beta-helix repeat-containing protein [Kofleriaceae bacterium]